MVMHNIEASLHLLLGSKFSKNNATSNKNIQSDVALFLRKS